MPVRSLSLANTVWISISTPREILALSVCDWNRGKRQTQKEINWEWCNMNMEYNMKHKKDISFYLSTDDDSKPSAFWESSNYCITMSRLNPLPFKCCQFIIKVIDMFIWIYFQSNLSTSTAQIACLRPNIYRVPYVLAGLCIWFLQSWEGYSRSFEFNVV